MTDTIEANKKIAEFDGLPVELMNYGIVYRRYDAAHGLDMVYQDHDLQYHTSWDWLMPAAKKFVELPYMVGLPGFKTLVINHIAAFDIEEAHRYLVKGIDFYTTTKTENK